MLLARRQASEEAELLVLWHENAVLRRQIGRVRYQPADRLWLAALSRLITRRRWGEVFAVTPGTLLAWHRRLVTRKCDYTSHRRPGRPRTTAAIRMLVIGASWATHYLAHGFDVVATAPAPGAQKTLRSYVNAAWDAVTTLGLPPGAPAGIA